MGIPPLLPSSFPTFSLSAHCRRHSSFDSPFPPPCCYHFAAPISSGPLPTQPPFLHLRQQQLQPSVQATSAATMHHRPPSPLPACTMHHSSSASTTTPHCYAVTPLFSDQPRHRPPIRRRRCCTDHALIVAHLLAARRQLTSSRVCRPFTKSSVLPPRETIIPHVTTSHESKLPVYTTAPLSMGSSPPQCQGVYFLPQDLIK